MKKIITVLAVSLVVICIAVGFYGCGADKDADNTTTTTKVTTTTSSTTMKNNGMVTDESKKGDNGAIGDAITKTSEGVSKMVTDISEEVSDMMD